MLWPRLRRNRNRRAPPRGEDAGNTHVLEAVIVVSIMVSAVVFVVTYDQPSLAAGAARSDLGVTASDALKILADTPVSSKFGDNALSAYIAECMNDRCDNLTQRLAQLVPAGASYALYVSNGYDTYPIIVQGKPRGEAATAALPFEPRWSSTFLSTATDSVGPNDPLLVYALPIFHSNALTPGGSQILVKVTGSRTDGSDYVLTGSYSTVAHASTNLESAAASIFFADEGGDPLPVHDLAGKLAVPQRVHVRVAETQGGSIPAGTEVALHVPRGWTAVAPAGANPGWTDIIDASDPGGAYVGSTLRAALVGGLSAGGDPHEDLAVDLTYHGDVLDVYPFVATLSRGATGIASMLLRGDARAYDPDEATPALHMSVPSPLGRGAPTTWTLSAYIPVNDSYLLPSELSNRVRVHTIEIMEQEGNPIFDPSTFEAVEGGDTPWTVAGGDWTVTPSSLVWRGEADLHFQNALNLSFRIGASGTPGPQETRAQFMPPVSFDTHTGRLVERSGWGFYRQAMLPATEDYAGYDTTPTAPGAPHAIASQGVYRQTELPGASSYHVETLGALQDSLYGSYVLAERRSVPVGGEVVINANVQSLLFRLAEVGQKAGVTLRFYPPWSGDERVPIYEQENLDQGLLAGEVSQLIVLDINGDGHGDPVVGTTNGRVIAYHGLTGQRLQGNTFSVLIADSASQQKAFPKITAMAPITLRGVEYIVVATDKNSDGVFVLSKDFTQVWSYRFNNADTLAIHTTTDMNGDGEPEIVVARAYEVGAAKNALVYVFEAVANTPGLVPITPTPPVTEDEHAFFYSLGTPLTVLAQDHVGPTGAGPGILIPTQTLFDPGLRIDQSVFPPNIEQGAASTPRAGVQGLDQAGKATSTLFGAPASALLDYDYDGDGVDDVVLGGASGYVVSANGRVLTQPLYSYILTGGTSFIDADTRSSAESYGLTSDGQVVWTDDAWVSIFGPDAPVPGAKAIAANAYNSYWVVGAASQVWRSVEPAIPQPDDPSMLRKPGWRELEPVVVAPTRAGLPYNLVTNLHELRDVWFRGQEGWIVGSRCPITCTEPIVMATFDGGATWAINSSADTTLRAVGGGPVTSHLNTIEFASDGTGWIVGDGGALLRKLPGSNIWQQLPVDTTLDLLDISCKPSTPAHCIAVGKHGAYFETSDGGTWTNLTGQNGLPTTKTLFSVGHAEDERVYIGSNNTVFASFLGAKWTTLPLNYVENDARVVSTNGDGTGFLYGGGPANGRLWLLHDYHIRSKAQTVDLGPALGACSAVKLAHVLDGNITFAQQTVALELSLDAITWTSIGALASQSGVLADNRKPQGIAFADYLQTAQPDGCHLYARISLTTAGDKTILSPHVRRLDLNVTYATPGNAITNKTVVLDFGSDAQKDPLHTTADWNVGIGALRQPLVAERWTRNVSGEVYDMLTGYDLVGAGAYEDVWVATGNILSENSPDYAIYAGTNLSRIMGSDNRVYLLDGRNGDVAYTSPVLDGEVRKIRLADIDQDGTPETLYATTWDSGANGRGTLYALEPETLAIIWETDLGREVPVALGLAKFPDAPAPHDAIFVGTTHAPESLEPGHLHALNGTTEAHEWRILPDDLGKYLIAAKVEPGWLFGPYVVEVEVEWSETVTSGGEVGQQVLRSARFYDHFVVTPPDLVSPPTPVYTARLLIWMQDWS